MISLFLHGQKFRLSSTLITGLSLMTMGLIGFVKPVLAGDPFRTQQPRPMGKNTEMAFDLMFKQGNYKAAKDYLTQALSTEANEPLVYAMMASLSYIDQAYTPMKNYAKQTGQMANLLGKTDPLRGNIYTAVSIFLEGGSVVAKEGVIKGGTQALGKLQEVFRYLDTAEKIDASDPELNLLKGYMDLILATNLPFSSPNDAITRLSQKAKPNYLSNRGIALAYRDLKQYDQALVYVDKSLQETPNNPELLFLKAQILVNKGKVNNQDKSLFMTAQPYFESALKNPNQLPKHIVTQMFFEMCQNRNRLDNGQRACDPMRDKIRESGDSWGPVTLPPL